MNFKNVPDSEKPRERLIKYGKENLNNEELIAIILRTGNKKYSVKELANNILTNLKDIRDLKNIKINNLTNIEGIGKIKAIELISSIELGRRVYEDISLDNVISCSNPINIINYFNYLFKDKKQEEFYCLYLDNKKNYLDKKLLFIGTINMSTVHPREIFKEAYLLSASYIICLHNHPSGDVTPSTEDIEITRKIKEIGLIHSIVLVDHIIIGNNNYYSFYENRKI